MREGPVYAFVRARGEGRLGAGIRVSGQDCTVRASAAVARSQSSGRNATIPTILKSVLGRLSDVVDDQQRNARRSRLEFQAKPLPQRGKQRRLSLAVRVIFGLGRVQ